MCLGGLKDLSIIAPQSDRLAIHTLVAKMPNNLIAEAIENELARSGYDWGVPMRSGDVRIARLMRIRQRLSGYWRWYRRAVRTSLYHRQYALLRAAIGFANTPRDTTCSWIVG